MAILGTDYVVLGQNRLDPSANFPEALQQQLLGDMLSGKGIKNVVFNPDNTQGFLILYQGTTPWLESNMPSDVVAKLNELTQGGFTIKNVIFNPGDGSGWLILCEGGGFVANGNFASDVFAKIGTLINAGFVIVNVVFAPTDPTGWMILCEGNASVETGSFPAATTQGMTGLINSKFTLSNVVFCSDDASVFIILCQGNAWTMSGGNPLLFKNLQAVTTGVNPLQIVNVVMTLAPFLKAKEVITNDSMLQDGDILLFVPTDLTGQIINDLSGGNGYSHAGLVCGTQMVDVDNTNNPTDPEVELLSLSASLTRLHVGIRIGLNALQAFQLCNWCIARMGEGMDWTGILTDGVLNEPGTDLCSMLIMHGLDAIGFNRSAVGLGGTGPGHFVSPNAIARAF